MASAVAVPEVAGRMATEPMTVTLSSMTTGPTAGRTRKVRLKTVPKPTDYWDAVLRRRRAAERLRHHLRPPEAGDRCMPPLDSGRSPTRFCGDRDRPQAFRREDGSTKDPADRPSDEDPQE